MNLAHALKYVIDIFKQNDIPEPEAEASVLLCHLLKMDKSRLHAQQEMELEAGQFAELEKLVGRRLNREPAAYIIRNKEFYGIELYVDSRVLIPRPETEILVEEAIKFAQKYKAKESNSQRKLIIADVGTGSGAIAIALAVNLPQSIIYATDISEKALEVAAINVKRLGLEARIILIRGDLLDPIDRKLDMIVANLPYIAEAELGCLQAEVACHEPGIALQGGADGLQVMRRLIGQASGKIAAGGAVLLEIGAGQERGVTGIVHDLMPGSTIELIKDFGGINRVVRISS
ncbi:MAG: peptide chain release factor N(5)-glutamine methyltransferase [Dehalococcoidia bacterium]|nr:peptide chain release factor N(5)-glutamine methyltransferase [Dehalococcoidia bacterium]MDD5494244.1 peptide chain release factor N(5)-glutamine methyltransferase [Dehalococcoidia bacterium]